MWKTSKHTYTDSEGQKLNLEIMENGEIVIEAKDGIFFNSAADCLEFLEQMSKKVEKACHE